MMTITGIIPVAKWLAKIQRRSDVGCRLCNRAPEQRGSSTNLPEEMYGHINRAVCDGMATTLWQEEEFEQVCRRESLVEKEAEIEKTISVKEHERKPFEPFRNRLPLLSSTYRGSFQQSY